MKALDWSRYPNFEPHELVCKHCKQEGIRPEMMELLQNVRVDVNLPFFISSGYRCKNHPIEHEKDKPGEHTLGLAVDVLCYGKKALELIFHAQSWGVKRIGIHQKGIPGGRYVHLGIADRFSLEYPAAIWTY